MHTSTSVITCNTDTNSYLEVKKTQHRYHDWLYHAQAAHNMRITEDTASKYE